MAGIAIESAFESFPEASPDVVLELLQNFAAREPPQSPALRPRSERGRPSVWPMDRSTFLLDEKRLDATNNAPYIYESFYDQYGDETQSRWDTSEVIAPKTEEGGLRTLCHLMRKMIHSQLALPADLPRLTGVARKLVQAISQLQAVEVSTGALAAVCVGLKTATDGIDHEIVNALKQFATTAESHSVRRAAAVGLAAALKGFGLSSIKKFAIVDFLQQQSAAGPESRQLAVFVFESLFRFFGYPFEPYVVVLTGMLVSAFDDSSGFVRSAASRAAGFLLRHLSSVAVQKLLPLLVASLSARSARLKCGATLCLGFLTECGKRSLSVSLPVIVPQLAQLVNDANLDVRKLAGSALENIAQAIPNPEVGEMAPKLLGALANPNQETEDAIRLLMGCSYVHAIDAASLSFVMPILQWGLRDRKAEIKRCSVQIVGTLVSLVRDDRDLIPYLAELDPALRLLLGDAIPDTRLFSSRAFAMMLQKYGETRFPDLIEWLLTQMELGKEQIVTDGATLGLSEALGALGIMRFAALLPLIRQKLQSSTPHVRTCYMGFLMKLPVMFPAELPVYIVEINQLALQGFGDNSLEVRSVALQLGIELVQAYYEQAEELLLPTIENAMWHESPNTQEAALMLLGYLLARIAGEMELSLEPDEMQGADSAVNKVSAKDAKRITDKLGKDRHEQLLCVCTILRSSPDEAVSNMAGRVLRSLVENVNAQINDMFPSIMDMVLPLVLGNGTSGQTTTCTRCMGSLSLTNKMMERVIEAISPLCNTLRDDKGQPVEFGLGVVQSLREIVANGNDKKLLSFCNNTFIPTTIAGLCYPHAEVRTAAVALFVKLHEKLKDHCYEPVIAALFVAIESGDQHAEDGLKQLLGFKIKANPIVKAFQAYSKAHPSNNDVLDALTQEHAGKEVKKKEFKMKPKKAAKHDFIEPGKNKIKKVSKKLTKAEIAVQEEMQALKKAEAVGLIKQGEKAKLQKKQFAGNTR